jgi:hypothetical protein
MNHEESQCPYFPNFSHFPSLKNKHSSEHLNLRLCLFLPNENRQMLQSREII